VALKQAMDNEANDADLTVGSVSKQDSAVDKVAAQIRCGILNGEFAAGAPVSIAALSERFGVSHIPVREALSRLEAQGLITLRPGRSAMVGPLDRNELRAIYRLRKTVEADIAARACLLLTPDDFVRARHFLAEFVADDQSADDAWEMHKQFHLTLLRPALSDWDSRILEQLWHASDRYTRVVYETYNADEQERKRREVAHLVLLDAAKTGSPNEFKSATTQHLTDHEIVCLEWLAALNIHNRNHTPAAG
jgi:DNA-binding GntR family transcriptional regulator